PTRECAGLLWAAPSPVLGRGRTGAAAGGGVVDAGGLDAGGLDAPELLVLTQMTSWRPAAATA
ncbi:MAG: hypothetical protein ACRD0H_11215, partial [Actinomycetes bacterium]